MPRFVLLLSGITSSIAALTLAGCATSSMDPNVAAERSVQIGGSGGGSSRLSYFDDRNRKVSTVSILPDVAWVKLASIYPALSIPVTTIDSSTHAMGAVRASLMGHIGKHPMSYAVDCGQSAYGTPRSNSYHKALTALTQVKPAPDGSTITTVVSAFAQDPNQSSTSVQCSSTGALERDIAAALAGST